VQKGIYALLITLNTPSTIIVGKLGQISFPEGHYAYVGSARNGLSSRIARHLRKEKALHWHIDYLLKEGIVKEVIYGITEQDKECAVALQLKGNLMPILRFGCSDCRCKTHLFFCHNRYSLKKIIKSGFVNSGLDPKVWRDI
jgi:Uri superfamily endonuclease